MFFRSERLFLRPVWPEDAPALYAAIADESVVRNLGRVPWPYALGDAQKFAARQDRDPRFPACLITRPDAEGSEVIGGTGLFPGAEAVELGYWIARKHWGQGFASEALRAMLSLARALGHRRLMARPFVDNPASGRVLARAGFVPSGGVEGVPCMARGHAVPALLYFHNLGTGLGHEDDGPDGGMTPRQAA